MMSFGFKIRDFFKSRAGVLEEVGIMPDQVVLDFGCGPGSYIRDAAAMVGPEGKVYALDIHPLAIKYVKSLAHKHGLANVTTIQSDCATGLADVSIDVVLLYDIFHHLENAGAVLAELHRVLKSGGIISVSDHHLSDEEIADGITAGGLFAAANRDKNTHSFTKR